jgi:hypothetical protein
MKPASEYWPDRTVADLEEPTLLIYWHEECQIIVTHQ